jgi:hypothetical protein
MKWVKQMGASYMGFAVGTIFGAIVATLTSYVVFTISFGEMENAKLMGIQDCLIEKLLTEESDE